MIEITQQQDIRASALMGAALMLIFGMAPAVALPDAAKAQGSAESSLTSSASAASVAAAGVPAVNVADAAPAANTAATAGTTTATAAAATTTATAHTTTTANLAPGDKTSSIATKRGRFLSMFRSTRSGQQQVAETAPSPDKDSFIPDCPVDEFIFSTGGAGGP